MRHVSDEELLERVEAESRDDALDAASQAALAEARDGLALAREAGAAEPGAEFWAGFEREVQRRLEGRARPGLRVPRNRTIGGLSGAAWLAAAAALAALTALAPGRVAPPAATPWTPLPPAEQDAGWQVLMGLGPETAALEPLSECRVEECVWDLSEGEQSALAGLLREELAGRES